jgi:hypothetical protein
MLSLGEVQACVPANLKKSVQQSLVDELNQIASDPMIAEQIRENFVSYAGVLKDGKFKTEDYLAAVAYVSYKLMGDSNKDAWGRTFPQRYALLVSKGASEKDISAHVAAYNKGKLVNMILEQTMVPTWVLNADLFQKALNVQADLMNSANSEKVRSDAANSILTHLKRPEAVKGQLDITVKDSSGMNELKNVLGELAAQQRELMANGTPIKLITDATIIENEDVSNGN